MTDKVVLVVAAHPDDELLGVGGTTCAHAAAGDRVEVVIVAEGVMSRHPDVAPETLKPLTDRLREAGEKAAQTLGTAKPQFLGLPDQRLDTLPLSNIIQRIEAIITKVRPQIIYTHHTGDLNLDHRIIHDAVVTACRPLPDSSVTLIRCFETVSSTEWSNPNTRSSFDPTDFVDISKYLERKLEALTHYESEMRSFPHARSLKAIRALAEFRGASVGRLAAEAFVTVRRIEVFT